MAPALTKEQVSPHTNAVLAHVSSTPVLLELFTSEGCSSCPPADDMLAKLDHAGKVDGAKIIALGEHVDYWNGQGWHDRFSSHEFTERQQAYAEHFKLKTPFTPEMVVDGRVQFVGNDPNALQRAISQEALTTKPEQVRLNWDNDKLDVRIAGKATHAALVMLAITESDLTTVVKGGENDGRILHHAAVVRRLVKIGKLNDGAFSWEKSVPTNAKWNRANMKAVVFVQDEKSSAILGVQSIGFPRHY
jgi:hypothetical protein